MKGFIALVLFAAWSLCLIGGLVATVKSGEYVQAIGVAVTSAMAFPYVKEKVMEGLK